MGHINIHLVTMEELLDLVEHLFMQMVHYTVILLQAMLIGQTVFHLHLLLQEHIATATLQVIFQLIQEYYHQVV